ncbi:TRAP transporter large permease subunit, partial [Thioclava sp. BHET1]
MGIELITILIVLALLGLMALGVPLGITTLAVSLGTAILYFGTTAGFFLVSANVTEVFSKYDLVAVPFFVFMANVLERSGMARELFDAMAIAGGRFHGSIGVQTSVVAVLLAAMSGVMGGEIVILGLVALPQMLRLGYD